jgi:inner membrane protein
VINRLGCRFNSRSRWISMAAGIFFAPFGVQNEATLKSNWLDPGFRGGFLPAERSVRPDGFDAKWKVSYYRQDYPQSWTSRAGNERFTTQAVSNSLVGAQFLSILDAYRHVERSIEYPVLFQVLVFTAFFLFEVTARQDYALLMGAIALFVVLAIGMYVTRKVNWYARDAGWVLTAQD